MISNPTVRTPNLQRLNVSIWAMELVKRIESMDQARKCHNRTMRVHKNTIGRKERVWYG